MTAKVGQPGEYSKGTLRVDLNNQKATFFDASGGSSTQILVTPVNSFTQRWGTGARILMV